MNVARFVSCGQFNMGEQPIVGTDARDEVGFHMPDFTPQDKIADNKITKNQVVGKKAE